MKHTLCCFIKLPCLGPSSSNTQKTSIGFFLFSRRWCCDYYYRCTFVWSFRVWKDYMMDRRCSDPSATVWILRELSGMIPVSVIIVVFLKLDWLAYRGCWRVSLAVTDWLKGVERERERRDGAVRGAERRDCSKSIVCITNQKLFTLSRNIGVNNVFHRVFRFTQHSTLI